MTTGVLVAGAGEAAVQLAVALRAAGHTEPILLAGAEPHPPYQRPPLSKGFLDGSATLASLALRDPDYYAEQGITLLTGTRVVDVDEGRAVDGNGTAIAFRHLVLATGARARPLPVPGAELRGVHTLRGHDDAVRLRDALDAATRVVIIGTGYIGLEIAAATRARGLPTTLVEQEPRLLSRVSAEPLSGFFLAAHRDRGCTFVLGAGVVALEGAEGAVAGVRLGDGRVLAADLVVVGIGAVPEIGLAQRLGLECRRGVVVDAGCRTSRPEILAIGDCTVQPHPHLPGELIGVESVPNAADQARAAAATITGTAPPRRAVPWFWSDQADLKLQTAGIAAGHDRTVVRRGSSRDITVLYYLRDRLIAADCVNRPRDFLAVKRALGEGRTIPAGPAADASTALKELITAP